MKKMKMFLFVFFATLLFPIAVVAGNGNELPDLPGSLIPVDYFQTWLHYVALNVVFLVPLINRLPFFQYEDTEKRILSWFVIAGTGVIAYLANWGIFDTVWYVGLIYIVAAIAGGHFGYYVIKEILVQFGARSRIAKK